MNPGIAAARKLSLLGYKFQVSGETIKACYEGPGKPDPAQVRPLLETIKAHKTEVLPFLRCYCPKCGGVCFGTFADGEERCLACHWQTLKALNPGLDLRH